ncbi:YczE/YyaS/YitT family protein [Neobacillus sp. D3-1R]|uniref:YczE/YyaS/YitT family protein n=1 Tax=Neobacillus sp. D3-1R TaxID=3445778 RepID=UPI003FA1267B
MQKIKEHQIVPRFLIFFVGLLILSLGIVLILKANLGATPWDVLHVGLYYQFGLTIGSWSIIVGFVILGIAALLTKKLPQLGAFLNMILVGLFIDMFLLLPIIQTPNHFVGRGIMFFCGLIIMCYGMGFYISANLGAGPRDSLMLALTNRTGWKVRNIRGVMEIIVLVIGWLLGGPVSVGTFLLSLLIGPVFGYAMPQCSTVSNYLLQKLKPSTSINLLEMEKNKIKRGVSS